MQKSSWIPATVLLLLLAAGASARELDRVARILTVPLGGTTRDSSPGFFDAHVHLNNLDEALARMEEHAIPRSILFWGRDAGNDGVLEAARARPDKLVPFLSVSPEKRDPYRGMWDREDPALLTYAESQLSRGGWRGIGEISIVHFPSHGFETNYSPLHPLMLGLMDLARKYRVPVMIHCEITRVEELEQLFSRHADVAVIWAHGGYSPLALTRDILARHPRVTIELSMRMLRHPIAPDANILDDAGQVQPGWLALIEGNAARFIVGSDATQRDAITDDRRITSVTGLLEQLTPETREKVARGNLDALLAP